MRRIDAASFDQAFALVVDSDGMRGITPRPSRLNALFEDLARATPRQDPAETMDLIWAIWIDHEDRTAADRMGTALDAMAAGASDLARPILDELVVNFPSWAEAWNKRATIAFFDERDDESIHDIARTLELEPRHFGAILGFAQICLRHGRVHEAKAAFAMAQRLTPHMEGLREVIANLAAETKQLH
jgi:predicted Zn-dependent protease